MCGTAVLEKKSSQKVLFLSMYIIFTLGKSRESLQNCAVRRTGGPTVQRGVKRGIWGYRCSHLYLCMNLSWAISNTHYLGFQVEVPIKEVLVSYQKAA